MLVFHTRARAHEYSNAIRNITRCIYVTRCELFHGGKKLSNITQKLIATVCPLLEKHICTELGPLREVLRAHKVSKKILGLFPV